MRRIKKKKSKPSKKENFSHQPSQQEHDCVMRAVGHLPEGDGQEHAVIMDIIMGRD
jgi:hypothetical protein